MPRTTEAAVRLLLEVDVSITDLSPFIEAASALVTRLCAPVMNAAGTALYYNDTDLELIERWLSAHFTAIRDPRMESEKAGSVGASYQNNLGLILLVTHWGQQAIMLDTAGVLAAASKAAEKGTRRRVGMFWLGSSEC